MRKDSHFFSLFLILFPDPSFRSLLLDGIFSPFLLSFSPFLLQNFFSFIFYPIKDFCTQSFQLLIRLSFLNFKLCLFFCKLRFSCFSLSPNLMRSRFTQDFLRSFDLQTFFLVFPSYFLHFCLFDVFFWNFNFFIIFNFFLGFQCVQDLLSFPFFCPILHFIIS